MRCFRHHLHLLAVRPRRGLDDIQFMYGSAFRDARVAEYREIERHEAAVHDQLGDRPSGRRALLQSVSGKSIRKIEIR